MRRVHLRGHPNILKRLLVHVCGANLGLLMRHLTGVGTPRSLQGGAAAILGPGAPRSAGFIVGKTGVTSPWTRDPRLRLQRVFGALRLTDE